MSESPDEIREQVEHVHSRLARDLNALETRVKTVTDWRWQFQHRPWAVLGAAFGAALVAGLLFGKKRERTIYISEVPDRYIRGGWPYERLRVRDERPDERASRYSSRADQRSSAVDPDSSARVCARVGRDPSGR